MISSRSLPNYRATWPSQARLARRPARRCRTFRGSVINPISRSRKRVTRLVPIERPCPCWAARAANPSGFPRCAPKWPPRCSCHRRSPRGQKTADTASPPRNGLSENGLQVDIFQFSSSHWLAFLHVHVEISSWFGRKLGHVHRRLRRWTPGCWCSGRGTLRYWLSCRRRLGLARWRFAC